MARLVLGEAATLPAVGAEDETAVLDLLTTERDAAVAEGTRLCNQLHDPRPGLPAPPRTPPGSSPASGAPNPPPARSAPPPPR